MATSIEELKKVSAVETDLPPFSDGTPFKAVLKKASIINMARDGKIPNPLMKTLMKVIGMDEKTDSKNEDEKIEIQEVFNNEDDVMKSLDFMMLVVENSLVTPTYKQIKECGVSLTDQQIFAIFSYALGDIDLLSKFC